MATRGTQRRRARESERDSKDMDLSEDIVLSSDDGGDDDKAAVRLHVVVKEPPRLATSAVDSLEEVRSWRDAWTRYFDEVKRVDVARTVVEQGVLKRFNLMLSVSADSALLRESELARMPALDFMRIVEDYVSPLAKKSGAEGLEVLTKLKGRAAFAITYGKEEVYPGLARVCAEMRSVLVKVGQIPNWEKTEDNQELANAFWTYSGMPGFEVS